MTTVDPARLLAQAEIQQLQQDGENAALRGDRPDTCPHKHAREPADQARRSMWNAGYAAGRTKRRAQS